MENCSNLEILTVPQLTFAHSYVTDNYNITFPVQHNFIEISYIESGTVTEYFDGNIVGTIPADSFIVTLYDKPSTKISKERHRHYTAAFSAEYVSGANGIPVPRVLTDIGENSEPVKLLKKIIALHTLGKEYKLQTAGLALEILGLLSREYANRMSSAEDNALPYAAVRYSDKAKNYIINHLDEKISLKELANYLDISEGYLSNVFKTATGQTVIEYVNKTKLKKVRELVITKKLTLREAGESVGLNDENYVSRMYKKYFGHNISDIKHSTVK
jgi:hypothetical protein